MPAGHIPGAPGWNASVMASPQTGDWGQIPLSAAIVRGSIYAQGPLLPSAGCFLLLLPSLAFAVKSGLDEYCFNTLISS